MKKIKYDLNYIKKNININEFIKILKTEAFWHLDSEVNIINYAIISCVFENNQDPNLLKYEEVPEETKTIKLNQEILINDLFDSGFFEKMEKYEIDGTLLEKINPRFKRIFHYELKGEGINNNNPNEIDSHTMYSLIDSPNKDHFYISKTNEYHQVVAKFDSSDDIPIEEYMNRFFFMSYIINFKETRGFPPPVFDEKYYINSKTGKNVLDEIGYDFYEKRILD